MFYNSPAVRILLLTSHIPSGSYAGGVAEVVACDPEIMRLRHAASGDEVATE